MRYRLELAYGYAGLVGWVVLTIVTVAFKLFPIWVWQERFQDFGQGPVPGIKDLYDRRLRVFSPLAIAVGVLATAAGILGETSWLIAAGTGSVLLGVAAFVVNFIRMARWALLRLEFHPAEEVWKKFRQMFPGR